jgi:hypothetical protein
MLYLIWFLAIRGVIVASVLWGIYSERGAPHSSLLRSLAQVQCHVFCGSNI